MESKNIYIQGIVQGVGFRPFVYQKAHQFHLKGFVANTSKGVWISIDGTSDNIQAFIQMIQNDMPEHARIYSIREENTHPTGKNDFSIIDSNQSNNRLASIPPDIATCKNCLTEMNDPDNHRYQYPFINCTHCGPRFTITNDLPFDRSNTSMASFQLCDVCSLEYSNPMDRRFHAQAVACPVCGPSLELVCNNKVIQSANPLEIAIQLLKKGKILAIKGLGGFHLAVDACNDTAVLRLRKLKNRPDKPFAIMSSTIETIQQFALMDDIEINSLTSYQCPIVILKQKHPNALSQSISNPKNIGVMLPCTPLHHLLTNQFLALVMTSGNISEQPIISTNQKSLEILDYADAHLLHNRSIVNPCDDSVVRVIANKPRLIRRSRGYIPAPIDLKKNLPSVLSLGGHLKNTICLANNHHAYLSQYLGDLSNMDTIQWMQQTIDQMIRITGIQPECVACDMHPEYQSSKMAETMSLPINRVQHHHAHIASCLAENGIVAPVIGIVLDGTGYGIDQTIWGGEVLFCENHSFKRIAHLETVLMPGGESAIQFPWKMALSWIVNGFGDNAIDIFNSIQQKIDSDSIKMVKQAIDKQIHSPLTSSIGRLFDAVSSMIIGQVSISYEGQAAIDLENIACDTDHHYQYYFTGKDMTMIHVQPMIREIVTDILSNVKPEMISGKFHTTLIHLFTDLCHHLQSTIDLKHIVLSGGVFQNERLFSGLKRKLMENGFRVSVHSQVPCNDGGLSLGQAYLTNRA